MLLGMAERGWIPDAALRAGIRRLLRERLAEEGRGSDAERLARKAARLDSLRTGPIAVETAAANEQHYEVPPEFFRLVLGPRLKYSSCYWPEGVTEIGAAEEAMLRLTAERAGIEDGMEVLDLGCGWGAFTLWVAERYPRCRVLAVSNSSPQRESIVAACRERGHTGVEVVTCDLNRFDPGRRFDRVVSVEMFEHMRNYEALLARIAGWLRPEGRLFVHVFCHREHLYLFEDRGPSDWMARHFFTGGLMPSDDLLVHFQDDLEVIDRWKLSGTHYQRSLRAWLDRLDARRAEVEAVFRKAYPPDETALWVQRWRLFFLACEELFGYRGGEEWWVAHTLMAPRPAGGA